MSPPDSADKTPGHDIRSLGEIMFSCEKFSDRGLMSASLDSSTGGESARNNTSWVACFHEKAQSSQQYLSGTPTHR